MDQVKTGRLIRTMRTKLGLTQLALAEQLGVSDKAVSKWERGGGAPDISLLPLLSQALGVDTEALLRGDLEENDMTNGNMKKMRFYRCPACGNLLFSTDDADVTCCGAKLTNRTRKMHCKLSTATANGISPHRMKCTASTISRSLHFSPETR